MYNNAKIDELNISEPIGLFKTSIKPFLKWAGGKSQLIPELIKYVPESFNQYIEPFLGCGAFYFYLNPSAPIISDLNEELLRDASEFLQNAEIINTNYLDILSNKAKKGDFIFLDTPYYLVGKYSDFKRYTKEFFYHEDHLELKKEFDRLVNLGCYVILTNSEQIKNRSLYEFSLAA